MLINILVPPSDHILQQAKKSPRLSDANFRLLVLVVSKFWRFRMLRTRAKAQISNFKAYEQKRYSVS